MRIRGAVALVTGASSSLLAYFFLRRRPVGVAVLAAYIAVRR
jgi:hypothetical protein